MKRQPQRCSKVLIVAVLALVVVASVAQAQDRVFATSVRYDGNLGGLAGGDAKCQSHADAAGLGGTWTAWLSTSAEDAVTRLTAAGLSGPFDRAAPTAPAATIATSVADLTDGTLANPVQYDETGADVTGEFQSKFVWTATADDGTHADFVTTCSSWTSNGGTVGARYGDSSLTSGLWTNHGTNSCDALRRLYCFGPPAVAAVPAAGRSAKLTLTLLALVGMTFVYWRRRARTA